jgi:preprotein translocase subunit SecE
MKEFLARTQLFFREVYGEFKRVNWPTRVEVARSTVVVLALVVVLAVFLWAVDVALSWPVERLLRAKLGG